MKKRRGLNIIKKSNRLDPWIPDGLSEGEKFTDKWGRIREGRDEGLYKACCALQAIGHDGAVIRAEAHKKNATFADPMNVRDVDAKVNQALKRPKGWINVIDALFGFQRRRKFITAEWTGDELARVGLPTDRYVLTLDALTLFDAALWYSEDCTADHVYAPVYVRPDLTLAITDPEHVINAIYRETMATEILDVAYEARREQEQAESDAARATTRRLAASMTLNFLNEV